MRWPLTVLLAAALVVAGAWVLRWLTAPPHIEENLTSGSSRLAPSFVDPGEVDRLIAAYEERIDETTNALDYRILGFLYLESARTSGDVSRFVAAEEAFRTAVDLFPSDPDSRVGLASALYSLHQFDAAREEASLVYDATSRTDALAVMTDSNLALGNYEVAQTQLDTLAAEGADQPAILVRRAEWARLDGRREDAATAARDAYRGVQDDRNPRRQAWYGSFAAQMFLYLGDYEDAARLAEEALGADPDTPSVVVTAARVAAATGRTEEAIELYEGVVAATPDPGHLAELHDLYVLSGNEDAAADVAATIDVSATLSESGGVYDRAIALFLADHDLAPQQAVDIARADLEQRQDVAAYDTLAWALRSAGDLDEAAEASRQAQALGTLDARILFHGGMIAAARGETDEARDLLRSALELSPMFDPLDANVARSTLDELG